MRVRARIAKSDTAETAPKTHRLTDIVVEEVSIVDRPANQRKFLVVKHADGAADTEEPKTTSPAEGERKVTPMKIAPQEKSKLAETLKSVVDAAAEISKQLEAAEAADGAALPEELSTAVAALAKLLPAGAGKEIVTPEAPAAEGDVAKAGRKISQGRLEALIQTRALLDQVISEVKPGETAAAADADESETTTEKSAPAAAPAAVAAPVTDASAEVLKELRDQLAALTETVEVLVKAGGIQKKRIDELAAASGGSRQVQTEKSEGENEPEEVSWPMDMNNPIKKSTTPVEKSFFD